MLIVQRGSATFDTLTNQIIVVQRVSGNTGRVCVGAVSGTSISFLVVPHRLVQVRHILLLFHMTRTTTRWLLLIKMEIIQITEQLL